VRLEDEGRPRTRERKVTMGRKATQGGGSLGGGPRRRGGERHMLTQKQWGGRHVRGRGVPGIELDCSHALERRAYGGAERKEKQIEESRDKGTGRRRRRKTLKQTDPKGKISS